MSTFKRIATTAERLEEAMNMRGMKQIDLVRETGMNRSTISRYKSGEFEPKQNAIYKLARALDVSEMWLWGYDCDMQRTPEHKKNDAIADATIRMMESPNFYKYVDLGRTLSEEKLESLNKMLSSFLEQPND